MLSPVKLLDVMLVFTSLLLDFQRKTVQCEGFSVLCLYFAMETFLAPATCSPVNFLFVIRCLSLVQF